MSRPRFLADHDLNEHVVSGVLRQEPLIDFSRVRDLGMTTLPDTEILAYAASIISAGPRSPCGRPDPQSGAGSVRPGAARSGGAGQVVPTRCDVLRPPDRRHEA